ncbi:MAG TPA: T9SS type A sorting domain-containing protein [Ignavibacteriaceae bacterium]|nr:T9SS type A sorting domain-containing protein [Ignavibacteriaceae bacterium]
MKNLLQKMMLMITLVVIVSSVSYSQQGWWTFDDPGNLVAAVPGYGNDLELTGTHEAIEGPSPTNGAVRIGVGSYYKLTHGIAPNGGGTLVNQYSLMFDFKVSTIGMWHTFFQVNTDVFADDGDYFKNTSGHLGTFVLNYSGFTVAPDTWYRLILSIDNGTQFKSYIDGSLIIEHAVQPIDDRWGLSPFMYLFGDNDGDDGEIDIAEVAIWNYPLSDAEIAAFGGVGGALPVELTSFTAAQLNGNVTLNWETASEINNNGFEIERAADGGSWMRIGFVSGYGTSTEMHSYSFSDNNINAGKYFYRLKQLDYNGSFKYSDLVEISVAPETFKLYNNYPNPFNPTTNIVYGLPIDAQVSLHVYNSIGEQVAELVNGFQSSGLYKITFDATSQNHSLPSGIYFVELIANGNVQRIKMLLMK